MTKYKTYRFWQLAHHVSSIIIFFILIIGCKSNDILLNKIVTTDKLYYDIINSKTVSKTKNYNKSIDFFKNSEKYSEEQKNKFIKLLKEKQKNKKNSIYYTQNNESLILAIKNNLKFGGNLLNYFGASDLKKILLNFPEEKNLNESKLNVKIIQNKENSKHQFSSAISINNEMVIYHHKKISKNKFNDEILIYDISNTKEIKLRSTFFSPISNYCNNFNNGETFNIEKNYYAIINDIILKKTSNLNNSKTTTNIISKTDNRTIKYLLEDNILNGGHLLNFFCEKDLKNALNNFNTNEVLNLDLSNLNLLIDTIKKKNQYIHQFSSPIVIKDKIVIFHIKRYGKYNFISELLIYKLDQNNNPKAVKKLYTTIS